MTMNVTDVVDRLGVPESIDWADPVTLTYGECRVFLPRGGDTLVAIHAPTMDAIVSLIHGELSADVAEPEPAPEAVLPDLPSAMPAPAEPEPVET